MKRLLVIGIMYTMFFLIGNIHLHADERTNVKEITSLEEPTWIFQAGISKGKYHDRQDLGFILQRNTPLKVRQTNPNFKDKLTVRLLSNDSKNEKSIQVGNEWVMIQGDTPLVPFI
ncbi:hypothetical protein P7M42_29085, partial [Vibrio parahaemolyticus]|nr:hypothetical protein [Vibrio parahaemolyticus]